MRRRRKKKIPNDVFRIIRDGEHEWTFEYPRLTENAYDEFEEAIDNWRMGNFSSAEMQYKVLIRKYPEFIDVYHHLALLYSESGKENEAFDIWQDTVELCLERFPVEFYYGCDYLRWHTLDNRPFLRAYHALGLEYLEWGETEKALIIFRNILDINPNDNQGIRAILTNIYLQLKRPLEVLKIRDEFPDDGLANTLYGHILALYQMGYLANAKQELLSASEFLPLVAKEIIKKQHRKPKIKYPGRITVGGADQAYYYWKAQGEYWKKTPGAIEFVREIIEASPSSSS